MKKLRCQNLILNNKKSKICIPIVGTDREAIMCQAKRALKEKPDIVEWRIDFYNTDYQTGNCTDEYIEILEDIHFILGKTPIILTFRTANEGGKKAISFELYSKYLTELAEEGLQNNVFFIDIEAYFNQEKIPGLIKKIKSRGVKVIASNHNFEKTPLVEEMVQRLTVMEELGADLCKLAVMPTQKEDVDSLIEASQIADKKLKCPIITMSMGELGSVTRICTNLTGSVITFASAQRTSAPGQIKCGMLKDIKRLTKDFQIDYNIILIGFMGTGKTTVSTALSRMTGLEEVDVDQYIVDKEGITVAEIFETKGEEYFRREETKALMQLQKNKGKIISCGGGAVLKDENIDILKNGGVIIQLYGMPETIFDRVRDNHNRPVLNKDMSIENITRLMNERKPRYDQVSDFNVAIDKNDRVLTCYEILKYLK